MRSLKGHPRRIIKREMKFRRGAINYSQWSLSIWISSLSLSLSCLEHQTNVKKLNQSVTSFNTTQYNAFIVSKYEKTSPAVVSICRDLSNLNRFTDVYFVTKQRARIQVVLFLNILGNYLKVYDLTVPFFFLQLTSRDSYSHGISHCALPA